MNPLSLLTGGITGGISPGGGGPSRAETGDASAGLTSPFQYNAGFTVGGSGTTSASQSASQEPTSTGNILALVGIALAIVAIVSK
jgi:hypothetical protein